MFSVNRDFVPSFHAPKPPPPTAAAKGTAASPSELMLEMTPTALSSPIVTWAKLTRDKQKCYCGGESVMVIPYCKATRRVLFAYKSLDPGYFQLLKISEVRDETVRKEIEKSSNIVFEGEFDFYQGSNKNCLVVKDANERLFSFAWHPQQQSGGARNAAAAKWEPVGGHDPTASDIGSCAINEFFEETGVNIANLLVNKAAAVDVVTFRHVDPALARLVFHVVFVAVSDAQLEFISAVANVNIASSRAVVEEARTMAQCIAEKSRSAEGEGTASTINKSGASDILDFFESADTTSRMRVRDLELEGLLAVPIDEAVAKAGASTNPCPSVALAHLKTLLLC